MRWNIPKFWSCRPSLVQQVFIMIFSDTWAHSFCNIWFRIQLNWFEFTVHVFHLFMQLTKQQLNGYDWQRGGKMASRSSCRPRHRTVITLNGESISKLLNILKAYSTESTGFIKDVEQKTKSGNTGYSNQVSLLYVFSFGKVKR